MRSDERQTLPDVARRMVLGLLGARLAEGMCSSIVEDLGCNQMLPHVAMMSLEVIRRWTLLDIARHRWRLAHAARRCQTLPDFARRCWTLLDVARDCWELKDVARRISDIVAPPPYTPTPFLNP